MDRAAFLNRVRSLHCIDQYRLPEFGQGDWLAFRNNPVRYLTICSDAHADAIWREVEKRQAKEPATDLRWLVTETDAGGKTIAWRWKMTEVEANMTADVWRLYSEGKVEVQQMGERDHG